MIVYMPVENERGLTRGVFDSLQKAANHAVRHLKNTIGEDSMEIWTLDAGTGERIHAMTYRVFRGFEGSAASDEKEMFYIELPEEEK